jgi:hypothetical protein
MSLLVDFLCRFGWGLAAALVITPATLVPAGFFRTNLLVVLGLATFAALLGGQAMPAATWLFPAAAAIAAWLGSIAWFAERIRAGRLCCAATAALLAAATVAVYAPRWQTGAGGRDAAAALLSGLVTGFTVHCMLLGHWYLNAPGMRVDVLRRMIDATLAVWAVQCAAVAAATAAGAAVAAATAGGAAVAAATAGGAAVAAATAAGAAAPLTATAGATTLALLSLRWLAGLVGLPVLLWLARETLAIPNTQSATGILYVACLAAILGELTAQLLAAA